MDGALYKAIRQPSSKIMMTSSSSPFPPSSSLSLSYIGSNVAQAGLEVTVYPRMSLNSCSSCLYLSSYSPAPPCLVLCGAWDGTQGFVHVKQALCPRSYSPRMLLLMPRMEPSPPTCWASALPLSYILSASVLLLC